DGWAQMSAARGVAVVAAALDARGRAPWDLDLRRPVCLLLGSEAHGLPAEWIARSEVATVPMRGRADSLNVGAAGAMLLYEALRQRA
ncbi:MAG TPA: TrmH family RNA methyltransferase, partial [Myxococcota bacterium]|nr:TrmH family RNA methyltransferase [Myxococcota bacterium]